MVQAVFIQTEGRTKILIGGILCAIRNATGSSITDEPLISSFLARLDYGVRHYWS